MVEGIKYHWAAENGQVVPLSKLPPETYFVAFQRLKEGSAILQHKIVFDDQGEASYDADYFIPEKVNERLAAEETAIEMYTQKIRSGIRMPDTTQGRRIA